MAVLLAALAGGLFVCSLNGLLAGRLSKQENLLSELQNSTGAAFRKAVAGEALCSRERLQVTSVLSLGLLAFLVALIGTGPALISLLISPWLVGRSIKKRQMRLRSRVEQQLPNLARSLSGTLTGGGSVRGALQALARTESADSLGRELASIDRELTFGAPTREVLERFAKRLNSSRLETFVAAILIQRRVGGDLARLLRDFAAAMEDQERLSAEVKAASAQARFTAILVLALPLFAALIAELLIPGFLSGILSSFLALWLLVFAAALQIGGFFVIRRIARAPIRDL